MHTIDDEIRVVFRMIGKNQMYAEREKERKIRMVETFFAYHGVLYLVRASVIGNEAN